MSEKKYKVWTCRIIVPDVELPDGFDFPPRMAAQNAIESAGIPVILNSSGWGGEATKGDIEYIKENSKSPHPEIHFAGVMDAPEDVEH